MQYAVNDNGIVYSSVKNKVRMYKNKAVSTLNNRIFLKEALRMQADFLEKRAERYWKL
jgi:hypothetical protein